MGCTVSALGTPLYIAQEICSRTQEKQCCTHAIHHWIATLFGMVMMFPDQLSYSMPQKNIQIASVPEQYKY